MFRRMVTRMEILALAAFGLVVVAGPARAQQGWPINGSNWSYYGGSGRSFSRSYAPSYSAYETPSYSTPSYATYYRPAVRRGYYDSIRTEDYYPTSTAESLRKRPVHINLQVPADAKVWFDGNPTNQTGTARSFESPAVDVGPEYAYQIRMQWKQDGKDVTQTQQVKVHAGDVINLTAGSK